MLTALMIGDLSLMCFPFLAVELMLPDGVVRLVAESILGTLSMVAETPGRVTEVKV